MDTDSAEYVLGGSDTERARLGVQAAEHEASARWLLREVGVEPGWRVLDVGCCPVGILPLLSELVGRDGEVIGLEREDRFVEMARAEVAERGLRNVKIVQGDALSAGLDRGSFDLVHERLVLVNVPERRELVKEMVSLTAPGGVVVLEDIDNVSWVCEPGHESWTVLLEVFHQTFRAGGGDPFVGRRLAGLLREAGVLDVRMSAHAALPQPGQYQRTHLLSLIESIREKAIGSGIISEAELDRHCASLRGHLSHRATVVVDKLLIQGWGRKAA
jgi:ubiquinone/menaquinone biosynthesis C-methylase UbiE